MTKTDIPWEDGAKNAPLPPDAGGLPLLGGALELMKDPLQYMVRQYQTLGPVFQVRALNRKFIVLAGPEANLFMSRHGDKYLTGKKTWAIFADEINAKHFLAAIDGEPHSRLRKITKKPYSRQNLLNHLPELVEITRKTVGQWPQDAPLTVFPTMQRLVSEQIGYLLLGSGPGDYFDDFVVFMRTLLNAVLGQRPKLSLRMPGYRHSKERVMTLGQNLLDEHQANPRAEDPDLVDYLLAAEADNRDILSEAELRLGAIGPYLAGIDTSAGTTSFMLYALLKNPDVIDRLRSEIDEAFAAGPLTAAVARQMKLTTAATIETLRMYPVAPMLPRTVAKPFVFGGYQFNVDDPVMVGTAVAHYDHTLYRDPYVYDIDRCLPPRKEHRQPGALAPFGLGAHTCAGAGFAEVQIMMTVATLLHDYDLQMEPADYQLKIALNPSPAPDKNFRISLRQRSA
ncbi:MAG: cytochrome P450 [Chloroflexi bacterium]|nr:cytochrome P450 [Chloroflexota bacterium]